MNTKRLLIVEDDVSLRFAIESFLTDAYDFEIKSVNNIESAKKELKKNQYNILLTDMKTGNGNVFDLLEALQKNEVPVLSILMSGSASTEDVIKAMKLGAYDVILKPFELDVLKGVIDKALLDTQNWVGSHWNNNKQQAAMADMGSEKQPKQEFVTNCQKMKDLIENLKRVAASKATVLIQGESGTGKEVLSNMIHEFSPRRTKPFVAINCAALPDNLLESELFGHEKGSFTGAVQRQLGKFEFADGGTILLDEISEMSLGMQTKLLRVLQECEIYRIGGNKPIPLDIRVIAATNRDLYQYMKEGKFREDLYYRINVIPVFVPPLRERGDDMITLADYYIKKFAKTHNRNPLVLDELAKYKLVNHRWQGNVRELRNAMERAVLVGHFDGIIHEPSYNGSSSEVSAAEAEARVQSVAGGSVICGVDTSVDMKLSEVEKRVILETLRRCGGNRTRTAEKLGISLRTLRNKLKAFREEMEQLGAAGA